MSATIATPSQPARTGDAFGLGVLVMLLLTIVQRLVGLLRSLGFCHFLTDIELGQWALVNSFLIIGVPIAVLGLPGSFGRFVEYFRARNQLGNYFRKVAAVSSLGLAATCTVILLLPAQFSWFLFRETSSYSLVVWCVITLVSVATFSFINELVAALREVRTVSLMQFLQSFVFAVVGLAVLSVRPSWTVLLPSFTVASLIGLVPGLFVLLKNYGPEFEVGQRSSDLGSLRLWQRILPYAMALWVMNLLSNLFEVSDRYMLLHLVPGGQEVGQAIVGQYHCGRILPNLLTSMALMLGGVLLPYLSADWEAGKTEQITSRMRQMLLGVSLGFTALSIAALCVSPLLFHIGFHGRFQQAEAILPISMLQAIWVSLFIVAQAYLLCIERGNTLAILLVVGLLLNLLLNWWLIQQAGLFGAVLATSIANLFALGLLYSQMSRLGCRLGWGTWWLCLTPAMLVAGPVWATLSLGVIVVLAGRTSWLLSPSDRQQIDAAVIPKLQKLGIGLQSLWS